jgi:hypothetical protein
MLYAEFLDSGYFHKRRRYAHTGSLTYDESFDASTPPFRQIMVIPWKILLFPSKLISCLGNVRCGVLLFQEYPASSTYFWEVQRRLLQIDESHAYNIQ